MKNTKTILIIAGFVIVLGILFSWNWIFPSKPAITLNDPSGLPGLQLGNAPWQPELSHLAERLKTIGLPTLSAEGSAMHIHQHLDIFIDGKPVAVPASIGINQAAGFISDIHVHDNTGIIHVESPTIQTFTLGQLFDIWGVRFTANAIGGYATDVTHTLKVYSNGTLVEGDPRLLPLSSHQEIVVVYGTATETPQQISSSYSFPSGY